MDKYTNCLINYRDFTDWTEDQIILARANAKSVVNNADDYDDPAERVAACAARAEALFESWQLVTLSQYDETDRARLSDLL